MVLNQKTHLKLLMLGLVLAALTVSGCEEVYLRNPFSTKPPVYVYVVHKSDHFFIPKGATIEWDDIDLKDQMPLKDIEEMRKTGLYDITPDGIILGDLINVEKQGWFYSEYAQKEIMGATVE